MLFNFSNKFCNATKFTINKKLTSNLLLEIKDLFRFHLALCFRKQQADNEIKFELIIANSRKYRLNKSVNKDNYPTILFVLGFKFYSLFIYLFSSFNCSKVWYNIGYWRFKEIIFPALLIKQWVVSPLAAILSPCKTR